MNNEQYDREMDKPYPNKRDCVHGSMRGKCDICDYENAISELELKLGIAETEIGILKEESTEKDRRIAELEKESKRDVAVYEQIIKDQRDTICLFMPSSQDAMSKLKQRDLEMQAKGIEDALNHICGNGKTKPYLKDRLLRRAGKLRNQAKGGDL